MEETNNHSDFFCPMQIYHDLDDWLSDLTKNDKISEEEYRTWVNKLKSQHDKVEWLIAQRDSISDVRDGLIEMMNKQAEKMKETEKLKDVFMDLVNGWQTQVNTCKNLIDVQSIMLEKWSMRIRTARTYIGGKGWDGTEEIHNVLNLAHDQERLDRIANRMNQDMDDGPQLFVNKYGYILNDDDSDDSDDENDPEPTPAEEIIENSD